MHILSRKLGTIILVLASFTGLNAQEIDGSKLLGHLEYLSSDALEGRRPLSKGSTLAQKYILKELASLDLVKPLYPDFIQNFSFEDRRTKKMLVGAANIVVFIPGQSSKKLIVITAHYDHVGMGKPSSAGDSIYNGADDNASGTAALLVLAEYFSKNRPKHGMLFAALDAEEMGLQGARALVKDFPYPLEQILLNVNMDMLSRSEAKEVYVSGTSYYPHFKTILEKIPSETGSTLRFGHDIPGTGADDWTRSSDHGAFFEKKVPNLYFGVEDHVDYHRPSDSFAGIHPEFYKATVKLILKSLLALDKNLLEKQ
ncbi:MAG: M28 family peptidase [Bacteroidetes bacterium]|nr:M28 family peptidase [Bacteroidota bacterium]MDA1268386.1 M28 family peptidase [Bacteroidota bacterium]